VRFERLLVFTVAAVAFACSTQPAPEPLDARSADRTIYISDKGLPGECYHDLGTLKFDEPFTDSVIDPDGTEMMKRLQSMALGKYPNYVDAVINVKSEDNSVGTDVTVTGEAIELVQHETVECAIRSMPAALNTSATIATGAAIGGMAGVFVNGQPSTLTNGAAIGAGVAGAAQANDKINADELQPAQITRQLQEQRDEIAQLQAERTQLHQCLEEEVPISSCEIAKTQVVQDAPGSETVNNFSASSFELQKQIQEQQTYIGQLRQQIGDIREQMSSGH
jgi:prefoldin subunit 5